MKTDNKTLRFYLRNCFRCYFIIQSAIIFVLFSISLSFAGNVTFIKEYTYQASELDSKASCRTISLEMVKRLLLEELGTYLISETEVKNMQLTKDQVTTYSAGIVSAEVIEEKWDGKTFWLKAKVSADPAEVTKSLQNIVNDKQKSKELEDVRKKAAEFSREIERLKKELEIAKADTKKPAHKADEKKIKQYNEAVKGLSATDWFEKGVKFYESGNYKEALNAYNKAIQLDPQDAITFSYRGLAYDNLGNLQQAFNDYNKAIQLDPKDASAYIFRGGAQAELENYQQAINDYSKAIQLNPKDAIAYSLRGLAQAGLKNYQQAINDYSKAIQLDPNNDRAYYYRGLAYYELKNKQKAIEDFKIAAKLGSYEAKDYLREKGIKW
ncbi:MAG: tetratricopeptide repeat protein [Thermodesulfovibrionales bacterium]